MLLPSSEFCREVFFGRDRECPGWHVLSSSSLDSNFDEDEGDQWSANQDADYWADHLIQNWFEQEIKLGIVRQGRVVVVGKVGWFPKDMM